MNEKWYESDNPSTVVRGGAWRTFVLVVLVVVAISIVGAAFWAVRVATSDVKGRGDSVIQKNDANNRIAAQERFESLYADVKASDQRIDVFAAALKRNPDSQVAQTNYDGAITFCQQTVADYNANARKYTQRDFRAIDLPDQIDNLDPATDCKETQR